MLHLFRKREERGGSSPQLPETVIASHVLGKFLKRLRLRSRPHLLDLGHLSGANIEFFARIGCKVQVEDLLSLSEPRDEKPEEPVLTDAGPVPPSEPVAKERTRPAVTIPSARPPASRPVSTPTRTSGSRPSRRIVLPPRTFPRHAGSTGLDVPMAGEQRRGAADLPARRLPTHLSFDDATFDAIIAWDVFNYYDPTAVRAAAAEARRVLKPGGLVLCYFHARRLEGPDAPRRYQVLDDSRIAIRPLSESAYRRQVYQNRDIEKMFTGLRIVEMYFLKNSVREVLMEKKPEPTAAPTPKAPAPAPGPRFTIE